MTTPGAPVRELPLADRPRPVRSDKDVEIPCLGAAIETHTENVQASRNRRRHLHELAGLGIDSMDRDGFIFLFAGDHDVDRLSSQWKAITYIDVVGTDPGQILDLTAIEVIDRETTLLVGADDGRQRRIRGVEPDSRGRQPHHRRWEPDPSRPLR